VFAISLLFAFPTPAQQRKTNRDPFREFVKNLPQVNRIEIIQVSAVQSGDSNQVDCLSKNIVCRPGRFPLEILETRMVSGADASRIVDPWRRLKRGHSYGCFDVNYILRFYQDAKLIVSSELCLYCQQISIANAGVIDVSGNMAAFYNLRAALVPDSSRKLRFERFKTEMLPRVGRKMTITGVLESGKLGLWIPYKQDEIYVIALNSSDLAKTNQLSRLLCNTVRLTGTLRYFPEPPVESNSKFTEARVPENFYFDIAEATVVSVFKPTRPK
jgi:hypothetical protein